MLCPEVWSFAAPPSNFRVERGSLEQNNCADNIRQFYNNHLVSVVLPDTLCVPEAVTESLAADCEYYKVSDLAISDLVDKDFVDNFVKKGSVTALSIDRRIDCEDCVCLTPSGLMVLSLTKQTYQTLGLDGKVSHFHRNTKSRYIVHVDLLKDCFEPGKRNYERTKACLSKLSKVTMLVVWEPPSEDVCPSSVAKYFDDLHYDVRVCVPNFAARTDYCVKVPHVEAADTGEFVEWLGAFSLEADLHSGGPNNYLSTYETPDPWQEYGQVKFLQWRGFFSHIKVLQMFKKLLEYIKVEDKPWVSLYVQGFSDCPISWGIKENHHYTNGDNAYAIIMNSKNYVFCKQMVSYKSCK